MKRIILFIVIPFILVFSLSFLISIKACNYALGNHPAKPLPFNHKSHLSDYGAECETCHQYYDYGRFKGIPETGTCFTCHKRNSSEKNNSAVAGVIPESKNYNITDKPWESYAEQPAHVYFSHKIVMSSPDNKMTCEACHEQKKESADTSMTRGKMLMDECEHCHTKLNLSNKCTVCHK